MQDRINPAINKIRFFSECCKIFATYFLSRHFQERRIVRAIFTSAASDVYKRQTQYSILDGAAAISPLIKRAKALGMKALAITDHGNMYGVKNFHDVATDAGIKPILGCETHAVRNRFEKDNDEKAGDHLILLAKNLTGYHNLCKIVSLSLIHI